MQLFPAANSIIDSAINTAANYIAPLAQGAQSAHFDSVLSSFIEEGRYDYSGRPAGFSACVTEQGTLDSDSANLLGKALKKRDVDDESIARVEALAASGVPLTIGRVFNVLSGRGRGSEGLEGDERDEFKMLLAKLGFSKDQQEEMLGLSDDGDGHGMWKMLSSKLKEMEGTADVSKKEWGVLLKGLDVSGKSMAALKGLFGDATDISASGSALESMLAEVGRGYAKREAAAKHAREQMRGAMEDTLKAAKIKEQSGPVDDIRGSRRNEQKEDFMQASVRKNTGVDNLKQPGFADEKDGFESREDGRSRSERILAMESDGKGKTGKNAPVQDAKATAVDTFFQRIDAALAAPAQQTNSAASAQNLNSMVKNFRQEIFSQVENGILQSTQSGARSLTLQLAPVELGQVTVILTMHQGEMRATIRAEHQESADALRGQLAELKAALDDQGVKIKEIDIQAGLQEHNLADQWDGHKGHNMLRDNSERDRMLRLARMRRDAGTGGAAMEAAATTTDHSGLHIVA